MQNKIIDFSPLEPHVGQMLHFFFKIYEGGNLKQNSHESGQLAFHNVYADSNDLTPRFIYGLTYLGNPTLFPFKRDAGDGTIYQMENLWKSDGARIEFNEYSLFPAVPHDGSCCKGRNLSYEDHAIIHNLADFLVGTVPLLKSGLTFEDRLNEGIYEIQSSEELYDDDDNYTGKSQRLPYHVSARSIMEAWKKGCDDLRNELREEREKAGYNNHWNLNIDRVIGPGNRLLYQSD